MHLRHPFGGLYVNCAVLLDGARVWRLARGRTKSFDVMPGLHVLKLKILRHDSGDVEVRVAPDEEVTVECRARPYARRYAAVGHRDDWVLVSVVQRRPLPPEPSSS
jgi:hypothetical protein